MIKKEYANKDTAISVLNKYYINEYEWPSPDTHATMYRFKYETERTAGIRIELKPELDRFGRHGFSIQSVEIVEPKRWTMFLLKWA